MGGRHAGTAPSDQIETLFDFNSAMQKVVLDGKPMFADQGGSPVSPRQTPNNQVSWSFSLPLRDKEAAP